MMRTTVSAGDLTDLLEVIRSQDSVGLSISSAVKALTARGLDPRKAKYILRQALDRGEVITDREFKLHSKVQVGEAA